MMKYRSKLSGYVDGVSSERFTLLLTFLIVGVFVFVVTAPLVKNHEGLIKRNEWREKSKRAGVHSSVSTVQPGTCQR